MKRDAILIKLWVLAAFVILQPITHPACAQDLVRTEGEQPVIIETAFVVPDDYTGLQEAVDALPPEGGRILIRAGDYLLTRGVHINRSRVSISGEPGTVLRLAPGVNQPVLLLGPDEEVPLQAIENLSIAQLELDGTMAAQESETDPQRPWIRNNGIDVRKVQGLQIERVNIHNARSGGLVISWDTAAVRVSDSSFTSNFFDGIAFYASRDIRIERFVCSRNQSAGISIDNKLSDTIFEEGVLEGNGDVGIFVRDSRDLVFRNLQVLGNGSHGAFLSHQTLGSGTGCAALIFQACQIRNNRGFGFWLASPAIDSPGNLVSGCLFAGNTGKPIDISPDGVLIQENNRME